MAELGLMGITASPEYGCAGADPLLAGIAGEELGRADITCATAVYYLVPAAWGHVLNTYGTPETKKKVFPSLAKGDSFLGIATTEPEAGSDLANMKTVAKRVGNEYIVNGEKMYISGTEEAKRLARAIASDIALYNQDKLKEGIENDSIFEVLKDEIQEGRDLYLSRINPDLAQKTNFYDRAIVDVLIKRGGQQNQIKDLVIFCISLAVYHRLNRGQGLTFTS
jgi:hypothetical protein